MLNNVNGILFCTCIVLVIKICASSWDFWPFNGNTATTPTVKIIPEADGNLIYFEYLDEAKSRQYIDSITTFLNSYNKTFNVENVRYCDFDYPAPENSVCVFDRRSLGRCSELKDFGYTKGSPCVYFTLSQVLNWTPIVLNGSDVKQHSDPFLNMPDHLNASIALAESENQKYVWLTCEGDTGADKEFMGPISYYPRKGFPTYYFPFTNVDGYQSPIVAVHFERPQRGVLITIECKAWAKNIQLDREKGIGFVKFHLLID